MGSDIKATIRPVGDRVGVYVQQGGWWLSNSGWVSGDNRTLLVDTCATERRTRALLATVNRYTRPGSRDLAAAITHGDGDHANGAGLIHGLGGEVLATPSAAAEILSGPHLYPEVFDCADWGDITPPEKITPITSAQTLDLGGITVEVHPVPFVAHTRGDLVVVVPSAKVFFTGDLFCSGSFPTLQEGSLHGWLDALRWLGRFEVHTAIPGHGEPSTQRGHLSLSTSNHLHWLDEVTQPERPDYEALMDEARRRWPSWGGLERVALNLRAAHAENHGYPLDVRAALAAMTAAAGGRIALAL